MNPTTDTLLLVQSLATVVIAVFTLVSACISYRLWRSTRDSFRLALVVLLRDAYNIDRVKKLTELIRRYFPRDYEKLKDIISRSD